LITAEVVNPSTRVKDLAEVFASTAVYPEEMAFTYLQAGLLSELGEALNVAKKVLRGDASLKEYLPRIIDEYGDVIWYAVSLCSWANVIDDSTTLYDCEREADAYAGFLSTGEGQIDDQFFVDGMVEMSKDLISTAEEANGASTLRVLAEIGVHLSHYYGRDVGLSIVSRKVAEKLAARKERGVLKGDGDNR
jgi:hypothetical protein